MSSVPAGGIGSSMSAMLTMPGMSDRGSICLTTFPVDGIKNLINAEPQFITVHFKPGGALLQVSVLMMILQMPEMGDDRIGSLCNHFADHCYLIIWGSLTPLDGYRTLGTVPYACTKTVAHQLRHQPYLTINNLQGAFMAVGYTETASVALLIIYPYYVSQHILSLRFQCKGTL